jgi:hypothetical protein
MVSIYPLDDALSPIIPPGIPTVIQRDVSRGEQHTQSSCPESPGQAKFLLLKTFTSRLP